MSELKRILLVEDDLNDAELRITGLAENNLASDVVSVRDGKGILDYRSRHGKFVGRTDGNPAVVLLDLNLPKVSGFEVLRRIKKDEKLKLVPVVILTASKEDKDIVERYTSGANSYVVKPVDFHQFVDAVEQVGAFWAIINEPPPEGLCKNN